MKVAAPEGLESSSETSTLSIGSLPPPRLGGPRHHLHMPKRGIEKSKRATSQGGKSADDVTNPSNQRTYSSGTSQPQFVPQTMGLRPVQGNFPSFERLSHNEQTNASPSNPEIQQASPQFFMGNLSPPLEGASLRRGPSHAVTPPHCNRIRTNPKIPVPSSPRPSSVPIRTRENPPIQQEVAVKRLQPHELMSGEKPGPIYGPFTSSNRPPGYMPPLQETSRELTLADCWYCPEEELSRQLRQGRAVGGHMRPGRPRRPDIHFAELPADEDADRAYTHPSSNAHPRETRPASVAQATAPIDTLAVGFPQAVADEREPGPEPESRSPRGTHRSRIGSLLRYVTSPFVRSYSYLAGEITTYMHERHARSGPLGSHDTETAQVLRRRTFEEPDSSSR